MKLEESIRAVMASAEGRHVVHEFLSFGGLYQNPFNQDPLAMAYSCGRQSVAQAMLAELLSASAEAYSLMLREAAERGGADETVS